MPHSYHVGVKGVVRVGQRCLVLKKEKEGKIYWDLPGGRMDGMESVEEALSREMSEEVPSLGKYEVVQLLGAYRLPGGITPEIGLLFVTYLIDAAPFDVALSGEHSEYQWLDRAALEARRVQDSGFLGVHYPIVVAALQ